MAARRSWVTAEFHSLIEKLPGERRREALDQVVDLFAVNPEVYSEYQISAFDDVICKLIERVDPETRRQLSEKLAPIKNAPIDTVENLARDEDIDIARPILTHSERITPELLLELASTRDPQFMAAIARRKSLDPSVTAALVKRGDKTVLKLIGSNESATIDDGGMDDVRRQRFAVGREKRKAKRIRARYNIWLDLPERREPLMCQLVDISSGGARIKLGTAEQLPKNFVIYLARGRENARRCEVAWRKGGEAGLRFLK